MLLYVDLEGVYNMIMKDFCIGDRVIATGEIDGNDLTDEVGTVIAIKDNKEILVEFDNEIDGGHDGVNGEGKYGHCWYIGWSDSDFDFIEIINEPEEDVEFEITTELSSFISEFCRKGE